MRIERGNARNILGMLAYAIKDVIYPPIALTGSSHFACSTGQVPFLASEVSSIVSISVSTPRSALTRDCSKLRQNGARASIV